MQQTLLSYFTLGVAAFSVILSIVTLYVTHFRKPKVLLTVGPHVKVYYTDYDGGGATGVYIPATFFNVSARAGVIHKAALEVYRIGEDQKRFLMHWKGFSEMNVAANKWKSTEIAHALPILGKNSVSKTLWFFWDASNHEKLVFEEGVYRFSFFFWKKPGEKPEKEQHEVVFDSSDINKLTKYRTEEKSTTFDMMLDRELAFNRLLNPHESGKLLG